MSNASSGYHNRGISEYNLPLLLYAQSVQMVRQAFQEVGIFQDMCRSCNSPLQFAAHAHTPWRNYGIIRGMKKNAKSAIALAFAIAGAFAAPLCSDAALDSIAPTTVQSVVASNETRAEKGLAFVLDVLAGWRGESAFASAEVQDHGEGAAGDCVWVGYSTTLYSTKGVRPFCFRPFCFLDGGR